MSTDVVDRLEAALVEAPTCTHVEWRALRERADLSLREVARSAGLSVAVVSRVERGERRAKRNVAQRRALAIGTTAVRA